MCNDALRARAWERWFGVVAQETYIDAHGHRNADHYTVFMLGSGVILRQHQANANPMFDAAALRRSLQQ
jgi:hypothetical protein